MAKKLIFFYRMEICINLQLLFKSQQKKIKNKKMAFARNEGKSQKNAYFWWFFEKFSQTTVIWRKMALSWIFLFYLIFFILSSKIKKKLVPKTQKQKNGIWSKWGRNRPKSTKNTPFHLRGCPGGLKGQFCRFRPHFRRPPFRHQWVFGTQFFFPLKLRI